MNFCLYSTYSLSSMSGIAYERLECDAVEYLRVCECWHKKCHISVVGMMLMMSVWFTAHAKIQFLEYIFGAFVQNGTSLLSVLPISSAAIKIMNSKVISETSWVDLTCDLYCYHFKMLDELLSSLKIGDDMYILGVGTIWLVRSIGAARACCL